jgi:hypothetical protein
MVGIYFFRTLYIYFPLFPIFLILFIYYLVPISIINNENTWDERDFDGYYGGFWGGYIWGYSGGY